MNSQPYFLGLIPNDELTEHIWRYKRRAWSLVGDQQFLADPPHTTVYLAVFRETKELVERARKLAEACELPPVSITGWRTFEADPLTGRSTLVCEFDSASVCALRSFQSSVHADCGPLRDSSATKQRYARRWEQLSQPRREAVEQHGFPYCGTDWHPHLTIASIAAADWRHVADDLLAESPAFTGSWQALSLFQLRDEEPHAVASFPLAQPAEVA